MSRTATQTSTTTHPQDQLIQSISPWVVSLGYQIIHLEVQSHRQKILRIYIDHLESLSDKTIGIEDCVKVSKKLSDLLDQLPEIQAALPGDYDLEISSPGVDRPLRFANDFERFTGRDVRIHVYRPLTSEELSHPIYQAKNPKQKNFLGTLQGFQEGKVVLSIKTAEYTKNSVEGIQLTIPLPLISKANLEPKFDFEESDERE